VGKFLAIPGQTPFLSSSVSINRAQNAAFKYYQSEVDFKYRKNNRSLSIPVSITNPIPVGGWTLWQRSAFALVLDIIVLLILYC
jgi:hypothetical protein